MQNLPELKQLAKVVFEDLPASSSSSSSATAAAAASGNSSLSSKAATAAAQRGPVRVKLEREE